MRIVLGAVMSRSPFVAGSVWNRIHRLLGFQRLGHEVFFVEELTPARCVDTQGAPTDFDHCVNRGLFQATMERFGLMDRACLLYNRGESTLGLSARALGGICREADLLINMSGHVASEIVLANVKRRVFLDEDPVYTQLWHSEYRIDQNFRRHDVFFTVGLNVGTAACPIPDCGVTWQHLLPPVIPELWPCPYDGSSRRFTSIASWAAFGDLCYRGQWYRSKAEELRRFAPMARYTAQELEIALSVDRDQEGESQCLRDEGWSLTDARQLSDPAGYQRYIASSRAEIGIAKHAYVKARSGWFSDRSAHYLASGKPVLAQSTGAEAWVPAGRGFLTFDSMEQAVDGIDAINRDYAGQCRAAREFAEEYLSYRKVLPRMLEECWAQG